MRPLRTQMHEGHPREKINGARPWSGLFLNLVVPSSPNVLTLDLRNPDLDVLVAAGLVFARREGRLRWNHLNPVPIQRVYDRWVSRHVRGTAAALSRLKSHVESKGSRRNPRKERKTR